ncbi:MAG: ATP-grasp domain-containing protein [Candidatus Omnitrophota bacterium]|nr:ATP-grasp domain-containing protein [Candidatus Omnitrophota bacterium]
MKKKVLLTSFGGVWSLAFYEDFLKRGDYRVFFADVDSRARARCFVKDFLTLLSPGDPHYVDDLFAICRRNDIRFVIPGADEEALRLMPERARFERAGILLAVQDMETALCFSSKSRMYDFLRKKGFPVPFYKRFKTKQGFEDALLSAEYPARPLLIKPDNGRGGRGVILLSQRAFPNKDQLQIMDSAAFRQMIDDEQEYILMDYFEADTYDMDVLTYEDGSVFFGLRKRFANVSKVFMGNIFERHERIEELCRKLYNVLPTRYLIDYDIIVPEGREPFLMEVNPRPSGSTISYLPFGYNLYHILMQTYLDKKKTVPDGSYIGRTAHAFHRVLKDAR